MTLSLQEVDHLIKALETMSSYDIARARERLTFHVNSSVIVSSVIKNMMNSVLIRQRLYT